VVFSGRATTARYKEHFAMAITKSNYNFAVDAPSYLASIHFLGAAEVWEAYFAGRINQKRREELLRHLRTRLVLEVPLPA
jgi:hypothetical protein